MSQTMAEALKTWQENEKKVRKLSCQEKKKSCETCDNMCCENNVNLKEVGK